jgi:hypothetical protein
VRGRNGAGVAFAATSGQEARRRVGGGNSLGSGSGSDSGIGSGSGAMQFSSKVTHPASSPETSVTRARTAPSGCTQLCTTWTISPFRSDASLSDPNSACFRAIRFFRSR